MKVKAGLKSYEELDFSITIDASVSDWRALLALLEKMNKTSGNHTHVWPSSGSMYAWPLGGIVDSVRKMLENLDKTHEDVISEAPK